ncbi:hypothetical protein AAES_110351 [Amazona aestiva]|uniref:HAUS augmin-like complex subunit 6 N-terminal domain-containing protein n=1 Tax=Amazona aestiva TaxID=12930 RepID=A0A0Q3M846_AMAAE|nr:hypothetical protein AAES_110351 [Amazona aestiva]
MEPKWKERKWEGRHLWLYVLALGFERKTVNASRLVLGAKMFNTPNIGALHVIATFLFKKLDPARAAVTFKMKQNTENKNDKTERIQKIRSMWLLIMEMLTSLKKEKEVVDSVLDILENRVILDGTKVVVSVPQFLSYGVENDVYQDLHIETCKVEKTPLSTDILRNGKDEPAISETGENAGYPVKNLLEKTRDELAEEVAEAVVSESTLTGERKGMALEDLISSLCFDPFITRKQIPRTPENLLTEVRRSWRKAIQTEDSSDIKLNLPEVTIEEAPVDAYACKKMADSRFECFDPASSVPDFDPALSESKSQLSSTEFRPQKQMRISHIESPVSEASEIQESERTEAHGLKYIVLNNSSVDDLEEHTSQYVKSIMNTTDVCSENTCGMNVLPSDRFQGSLTGRMLHQNISSLLNSVSDETAYLGILGETFEGCLEGEQLRGILGETFEGCLEGEQLSSTDANQSASFESDFVVMDSPYVAGGSKNEEGIERSKLDVQSLFNLHKALEKTPSTSEKELHQILNGGEPVSSVSSPSLAPEKRERDEFSSPQELFFLDEEFTKMPSPESLNEIKYSLSSLLASFQHLEETASMVHEIPLDLKQKLKDKEHLDEKPAMKELSSR